MPNHSTGTILISIHAPVKGATCTTVPDPREMTISIHAPVKGATREGSVPEGPGQISIHAPVKGATSTPSTSIWTWSFQSTLP